MCVHVCVLGGMCAVDTIHQGYGTCHVIQGFCYYVLEIVRKMKGHASAFYINGFGEMNAKHFVGHYQPQYCTTLSNSVQHNLEVPKLR